MGDGGRGEGWHMGDGGEGEGGGVTREGWEAQYVLFGWGFDGMGLYSTIAHRVSYRKRGGNHQSPSLL